jgi:UDP-N-acetylglucosamine/UDP-N-acetylgalactosamine diphosphorylase
VDHPPDDLRDRLAARGQGHLLQHWGGLDPVGRERLVLELDTLDLDLVERLAALLQERAADGAEGVAFAPPDVFDLTRAGSADAAHARRRGTELLAAGRVGFMLVAGGQGSRLGYEGPKGCFPIGPLTDKPLFAWHAARIVAAGRRHGFRPTWYVMTSPANDTATREFFAEHRHFGLAEDDVFFFAQAMLPALTADGRIVLEGPDRLFLAPNGHGGSLAALATSGALVDMAARGIEHLSYFQVDNPLARPADPLFIGLHAAADAGMSSKVVAKRDAHEKVGVIGLADGKLGCIEYSDLPASLRDARDADGQLLFRAGNIAAHMLARGFVEDLNRGGRLHLPWHLARKKLKTVAADGRPTEVDGVKFETFVFDALGATDASVTLEVERRHEFSPVKNATGLDSPATCNADLARHFAELAAAAGHREPPLGADGLPRIEIDPRHAETPEELRARAAHPESVAGGHHYPDHPDCSAA